MIREVSFSLLRNSHRFLKALSFSGLFVVFAAQGQQGFRGLTLENDRYNRLPIHPGYGKFEKLPSFISNKNYFPRVINQTQENNSVGWSTAWYGMGALYARLLPLKKPFFSPAFTYRVCNPGTRDCINPMSLIDALQSLTNYGSVKGNLFDLFCAESISTAVLDSAKQNRLSGYVRIFNTYDSKEIKVQSLKRALIDRNPVVIGILCPASFQFAKEFWQPREKALIENGGHSLCIVGYDDSKYGGAFEVVNSWGKAWGKDGYTWFRYDDVAEFVLYGFEMMKFPDELSAGIKFETNKGEEMKVNFVAPGRYQFARHYKTGEQFRMKINTGTPLLGRVIAIDPGGQQYTLFPLGENSYPLIDKELILPGDSPYLQIEGAPGVNKIIVVFSSETHRLEQFQNQMIQEGTSILTTQKNSGEWFRSVIGFKQSKAITVVQIELVQE